MVGVAVEKAPATAKEIVDRGHEAAAHGYTWEPHWRWTPEQERESYQRGIDEIVKATGTRPTGFNAFALRGTKNTFGILQDLGIVYHTDDISRDEPFMIEVNGKRFGVVPYTRRHNDIERFQDKSTTARDWEADMQDEFDQLYEEAGVRRRMMAVSTHDRIGSQPHRVRALDRFIQYAQSKPGVVFMRKDEIIRWAMEQPDTPYERKS
jgi:peptidoglycan/xylan/chitin deacetylase (PgdA/CDA1 family)